MTIVNDLGTPAMVGILAAYKLIQDATDELPGGLVDLIFSNVGTLALSVTIGYFLYMANKAQRKRLDALQDEIVSDLKAQIEKLKTERNEYLQELLEEREEMPRAAKRRPA